jgi:hypothetical protein
VLSVSLARFRAPLMDWIQWEQEVETLIICRDILINTSGTYSHRGKQRRFKEKRNAPDPTGYSDSRDISAGAREY